MYQVIEGEQSYTGIDQLINSMKILISIFKEDGDKFVSPPSTLWSLPALVEKIEYVLIGLENTKKNGLELISNNYEEFCLHEIYKVLGWQGGTIHQAIDEIKRLKELEVKIKEASNVC